MSLGHFCWEPGLPTELKKWVNSNVEEAIKAFTHRLGLMASSDIGNVALVNDFDYRFDPHLDLRSAFDGYLKDDVSNYYDIDCGLAWAAYLTELSEEIRQAALEAQKIQTKAV